MGQALHIKTGLVTQIGSDTLTFETVDRTSSGTLTIGGANTTQLDLGTHANTTTGNLFTGAGMTALNIGTGMGVGDAINIGGVGSTTTVQGDLEVDGAEIVHGNSTFEGTVNLGNESTDVINVVGAMGFTTGTLTTNIPFTTGSKSISIAGTAGGNLTMQAGNNSGGAGGDVYLTPGTGSTTAGNLVYGISGGTAATDYQIMCNNVGGSPTNPPGIRYNAATGAWQVQTADLAWTNLAAGGDTLPSGTPVNSILQATGGPGWEVRQDLTLSNSGDRTITVAAETGGSVRTLNIYGQAAATAATNGGTVQITGGIATTTGAGGGVQISGASNTTGGNGGVISMGGGNSSAGNAGNISIYGGNALAGSGNGGSVSIYGGDSAGGTRGVVRMYYGVVLDSGTTSARVDMASGTLAYSAGAFASGTRFWDSDGVGMVFAYKADGYLIVQENAPTDASGGPLKLQGGAGTGVGGSGGAVSLQGGAADASNTAQGGSAGMYAGSSGTNGTVGATGGEIYIAATAGTLGTTSSGSGGAVSISAGAGGNGSLPNNPGAGGSITLTAGNSGTGGGGIANGGNINLIPGTRAGIGLMGSVIVGNSSLLDSNLLFLSSVGAPTLTDGPGFRYNGTLGQMEFNNGGTGWTPFAAGGGGVVPNPAIPYSHIEANAAGDTWTEVRDITLPIDDSGPRYVRPAQTAAATNGVSLYVTGGAGGSGNSNGGNASFRSGTGSGTGNSGALSILTPNVSGGGNAGIIQIVAGSAQAISGTSLGGSIEITAGGSGVNGGAGDITITAGAGLPLNGGSGGGDLMLYGGAGDGGAYAGGAAYLEGGASSGAAGGAVYVRGGDGTTDGMVYLGDSHTSEVQFGGTASTDYQFQGNTSNRLVTGSDGNTIVMASGTSHNIIVAQPGSGNGTNLRIAAGDGAAGSNGGDLYLRAGDGTVKGDVYVGDTYSANVFLGSGTGGLAFVYSTGTLQATDQVNAGIIDLPHTAGSARATASNFKIGGDSVSNNVTATNLGTLTAGSSSNADALHTHTGVTSVGAEVSMTWGGTVAAKDVVYIAAGVTATEAISDGTVQQARGIGVATTSGKVKVSGYATVVCVDAVAAAGVPVYVAPTASLGQVTTALPSSGFITQVGIAAGTCGAGGDLQILLQTAPPLAL